jgi:hypothetical protein
VSSEKSLVIACGALAREITTLTKLNGWSGMRVQCVPAKVHNTPEQIPDAVRKLIQQARPDYDNIFVAFADCGTGGLLDTVLAEERVERLAGAHCYEFYAGSDAFAALEQEELGTFYLTDFLARHFERLIIRELGISDHPELQEMYFSHYKRLVYLAQTESPELLTVARQAAERLKLEFEYRLVGYGQLERDLQRFNNSCNTPHHDNELNPASTTEFPVQWQN